MEIISWSDDYLTKLSSIYFKGNRLILVRLRRTGGGRSHSDRHLKDADSRAELF